MPYIGKQLSNGNYLKLDDISSSFNSSTTTFSLTNGGSAYYPGSEFSILVSVGGVIQEPESAYQINNDQITFANAPTGSDKFFCVVLGDAIGINVPGNNTVNGPQLAKPFNYEGGLLYLNDANQRVGINSTSPQAALDVVGDAKISGVFNPNALSTFYNLRVSNNLTVEGTTSTLDTDLIGVDRVEVDANSNTVVGVAITQSGTADILRLYDGASKVVTVDDEGNIGIGTDTPVRKLEVVGSGVSIFSADKSKVIDLNLGKIELIRDDSLAYIDFKTSVSEDYDCRIQQFGNGLRFYTGGNGSTAERLLITSDGRIGMHDSTPNDYELDINKRTTATDTNVRIYNNATGSTNDTVLRSQIAGTSASNYLYFGDGGDSNIGQVRYNHADDSLGITVNTTETIHITSDNKVGIGTDVPHEHLDVYANMSVGKKNTDDAQISIGKTIGGNRNSYIDFVGDTTYIDYGLRVIRQNGGANSASQIAHRGTGTLEFSCSEAAPISFKNSGGAQRLYIKTTGQVGLGTDGPGALLHLHGSDPRLRFTKATGAVDNKHWDLSSGIANILRLQAKNDAGTGGGNLFDFYRSNSNINEFRGMKSGNYWFVIDNANKQVGINTTNPGNKLTVWADDSDTDTDVFSIRGKTGAFNIRVNDADANNPEWAIRTYASEPIVFMQATTEVARFNSEGKAVFKDEIETPQDYPRIRPTLDLNFASVKKLDSRITYNRTGPASYTDEFGMVRIVGHDVPRFDHDPNTRECRGLLLEDARTNYVRNSVDLASEWTSGSGSTDVDYTITNPDGSVGAWYHTGAEVYHQNIDLSGASTNVITVSLWVKERSGQSGTLDIQIYQQITGSVVLVGGFNFNPATAAISTGGANFSDGRVMEYPNGWYRISAKVTTASGNFSSTTRFDLQGQEHYVWGMQLETAAFPSSFIPTYGERTRTRGKDLASIDGSNFTDFFNQVEGTINVAYWLGHDSTAMRVFQINDSDNSVIDIVAGAGSGAGGYGYINTGGVAQGNAGQSSTNANYLNNLHVTTIAYKTNDIAGINRNTGVLTTDTSATLDGAYNRVTFYQGSNGGDLLNGHLQRVQYYPKRLPNSQLETLNNQ